MARFRKSFTLLLLAVGSTCFAQEVTVAPSKPTGIYDLGERVAWTVSAPKTTSDPRSYSYKIKKNNSEVLTSGDIDLTSGAATIETSLNDPAMLYLEVTSPGSDKKVTAGAAVAPTKLQPVAPRPADFDAFWKEKIEQLHRVPANPVLTPADSGKPDVDYAILKMDHVNGGHVYGQIAKPNRPGKFPAVVIFQWASPPYPLQKSWVTDYAAKGWLAVNIEPHDVLPDQPKAYYDALPQAIKNYQTIGQDDRDKSYFLRMYQADYRAVDYVTSRDDWDGKTLVVMGTSMGGQQSLCVAGLHPKVTHVIVNEPAGCDTNAPLHGRQASYPFFPANDAKVMETALYFDAVNFAPKIKAKTLVAMGFVDTIAAPAGIWTAFNQIQGPKEAVPMVDSPHNHQATPAQQRPWSERSAAWMDALVKTGDVEVAGAAPAGSVACTPVERTDTNSQIAHRQLLEKAKAGRIDLYFLGDSITRRWGCTDPQYKDLMANWVANFHGWNAANFGWGGDTTQNILWRIQNGELDGVNPQVIVLLAGTNNIGPHAATDAQVADITAGIQRIVDVCHAKAPHATIILTGIFPRNDSMDAMPAINQINANLATRADGHHVRYININHHLATPDGRLLPGMMNPDNLHPTAKTYQLWADALKPILTQLLGPPSHEDHAPPPTGDPSISAGK